tara:strand:- start:3602 stop:3877 length:276 start_codon:yes stop_codon:yes gene_type:complete
MAKKLKGDFFYLSANDLKTGAVVYFTANEWSKNLKDAVKISREEIEKYEQIAKQSEDKCLVISPIFVELDELGNIRNMRDKIRETGITFTK